MTTIKIESLGREVTLLPLTHGMSRKIQAAIMEGVSVKTDVSGAVDIGDIPVMNTLRSEELTIKLRFGLSDDDIENILEEDMDTLKNAIAADDLKKKKPLNG